MNYLCMVMQKEAAKEQSFVGRAQAWDYFRQSFGDRLTEKLEAERNRLKNRIRYYQRREEKHKGQLEITEECCSRRQAAERELEVIDRKLQGEGELGCYYEEKYGPYQELFSGKREPLIHLAGICQTGGSFRVLEETYYCIGFRSTGGEGALGIRKAIPKDMIENCISLTICQESPKTEERFQKEIRKMVAKARKDFQNSKEAR